MSRSAILLAFASCRILPEPGSSSIQYVTVDPKNPPGVEEPIRGRVVLRPFTAPARYQQPVVVRNGLSVTFREDLRWVEPPAELVAGAVEKMFRAAGLFHDGANETEWELHGRVLVFDQVADASAECAIQLELTPRRGELASWHRTFQVSVPLGTGGGIAEAMTQALQRIGAQAVESLRQAKLK